MQLGPWTVHAVGVMLGGVCRRCAKALRNGGGVQGGAWCRPLSWRGGRLFKLWPTLGRTAGEQAGTYAVDASPSLERELPGQLVNLVEARTVCNWKQLTRFR